MTFSFVKTLNAVDEFFKEAISNDESKTTANVEIAPKDTGKYINKIINASKRNGGAFSINFSIDGLF